MSYKLISKKELPKSAIELEIEIPWNEIAKHENAVVKEFNINIDIPGFRKGHIPENILREKVGDMRIVEEMADMALQHTYPKILEEEKLNTIGRPSIVITKIARDNPVSIRATIAIVPKADLPDYKKIAKKVELEKVEVNDEEVMKFIEELRKNHAKSNHSYSPDHKHDDKHGHKDEDLILPEMNDEFVKSLGKFENVEDFNKKLKENLISDKERKVKEKRRAQIIENIINETKLEIPDVLVESELERMLGRFENDISKSGLKMEDYLKHIKKSKEDIRKDWRKDAEKQAAMHIILAEIAIKEKIQPEEAKVKEQYDLILAENTNADPMRVKLYIEEQMTLGMVIEFLEGQK